MCNRSNSIAPDLSLACCTEHRVGLWICSRYPHLQALCPLFLGGGALRILRQRLSGASYPLTSLQQFPERVVSSPRNRLSTELSRQMFGVDVRGTPSRSRHFTVRRDPAARVLPDLWSLGRWQTRRASVIGRSWLRCLSLGNAPEPRRRTFTPPAHVMTPKCVGTLAKRLTHQGTWVLPYPEPQRHNSVALPGVLLPHYVSVPRRLIAAAYWVTKPLGHLPRPPCKFQSSCPPIEFTR